MESESIILEKIPRNIRKKVQDVASEEQEGGTGEKQSCMTKSLPPEDSGARKTHEGCRTGGEPKAKTLV